MKYSSLNRVQFYKLCEHIVKNAADYKSGRLPRVEIAKRATSEVGFRVTSHNLMSAEEATGISLASKSAGVDRDKSRYVSSIIAKAVLKIAAELSIDVGEDVQRIAERKGVAKSAEGDQ